MIKVVQIVNPHKHMDKILFSSLLKFYSKKEAKEYLSKQNIAYKKIVKVETRFFIMYAVDSGRNMFFLSNNGNGPLID